MKIRSIAVSLLLTTSLGLASCGSEPAVVEEDFGDARTAVDGAEAQKTKALMEDRLKKELDQAGSDIAKIGLVYEGASAAGIDSVATTADKKLEALVLPQAKAAKRSSEVLALKKQIPIGPLFKKLDEIDGALLDAEIKAKQ